MLSGQDCLGRAGYTRADLKRQVEKPYEYEQNYFKSSLNGIVKEIMDNGLIDTGPNYGNLKALKQANILLDCLLIDEIGCGMLDYTKRPNEQKYFLTVNRLNSRDLAY